MDGYLSWDEKTITNFSEQNISALYERGFVFTRIDKGAMAQTRSVRINLNKFELTSENKRVLRKVENIQMEIVPLPHPNYDWKIHKLGHDFYSAKFGDKTFSANKIKELLTSEKSNYNKLFVYTIGGAPVGYCICFENKDWLHYGYPFYDLNAKINNLGIGMMTRAIVWAKENNKKYICLGSAQNPSAVYKTQFKGFEWFDGEKWRDDIEELKKIL
jgi:arginyl-tRNA--protein-N-Asp/Glu arginylyltransferase